MSRTTSDILGDTPASNLIEQPRNIGTAPAILYSVLKIAAVDPQAIIGFFPSDHYVSDNTKFMAHIRSAFETAHVRQDLVISTWRSSRKAPKPNTAGSNLRNRFKDTDGCAESGVSGKSPVPVWLPFCSYAAVCGTVLSWSRPRTR